MLINVKIRIEEIVAYLFTKLIKTTNNVRITGSRPKFLGSDVVSC